MKIITKPNTPVAEETDFFIPSFRRRSTISRGVFLCLAVALFLALFEAAQQLETQKEFSFDFFLERLRTHAIFMLIMSILFIVASELVRPIIIKKSRSAVYAYTVLAVLILMLLVSVISNMAYHFLGIKAWHFNTVILEYLFNSILASMFFVFALHYFDMQRQLIKQREVELRTQVSNLEARIAPHFFFNSMNTLLHLVETGSADAPKMVEDLSGYFRYSLRKPDLIKVSEEIKLCEHYMAVENLRLETTVTLLWDMVDDVTIKMQRIPSLLIQTILAKIIDGIGHEPESKTVRVSLSVAGGMLSLQCVFFTNQAIEHHNALSRYGTELSNTLQQYADNTKIRLQRYFGEQVSSLYETSGSRHIISIAYPISSPN